MPPPLGAGHNKRDRIAEIKVDNVSCTKPQDIADRFHEYFINIGPTLAMKISVGSKNCQAYLDNNNNTKPANSMFISSTNAMENWNILSS